MLICQTSQVLLQIQHVYYYYYNVCVTFPSKKRHICGALKFVSDAIMRCILTYFTLETDNRDILLYYIHYTILRQHCGSKQLYESLVIAIYFLLEGKG